MAFPGSALCVLQSASRSERAEAAALELVDAIRQADAALYLSECAPGHELTKLAAAMRNQLGSAHVIGCTTAGEITPFGYLEGSQTGLGIAGDVRVASVRLDDLAHFEFARGAAVAHKAIQLLQV